MFVNEVFKNYINCVINEELEEFRKFNPNSLNQIKEDDINKKRLKIQQLFRLNQIPSLGKGTSREAYLLDSKRVLKLSLNDKGIAQNKEELDAITNPELESMFAKIYDYDPSYLWLVSELVKPLSSPNEFEQLSGMEFDIFNQLISLFQNFSQNYSRLVQEMDVWEKHHALPPEDMKKYKEGAMNPFFKKIANGMIKGDLGYGDLQELSHYGKTPDQRIVLLDYGLTMNVWNAHYKSPNPESEKTTIGRKPNI